MEEKKDSWKTYFNSEEEKKEFMKKVLSENNIISAYIRVKNEKSLNIEISNRLLFELEEYKLNDGINSKIISRVKKILENFFDNYESFEGILIFKLKDCKNKEYRPLCIMDIETEIAVNCFLNIFLEEIKNQIVLSKCQFGNISPLLNYYDIDKKQVIENKVEDLYLEKWQRSYKQYNEFIFQQLEEKDISLYITDIKSFFVTITLENFFEFISQKVQNINIEIFKRVFLIKLKDEKQYEEEINSKIGISRIENSYYFTSLPQGCIFSAIFANIYLSDLNELNLKYAMYVDDLHVFFNKVNLEKQREKLIEYLRSKKLEINLEKTTELANEELISDYKKLIKNYGTNVSILRNYSNNREIDITKDKYILNNSNDIKIFLENKIKDNPKLNNNNIYQKYLKKINKMKEYREVRYYTYKSDNINSFEKTINELEEILYYLKNKVEFQKEYDIEKVLYQLGAYNAKLYDIEEYIERLLDIYRKSNDSYINNVLFRFLNRNLIIRYEEFKKISNEKNNILFKDEFYKIRNIEKKPKVRKSLKDGSINIVFINKEENNIARKKMFVLELFKKIKTDQEYIADNIFYKIDNNEINFKFESIDREIETIRKYTDIYPERTIINYITNLINVILEGKNYIEYTVWEYRLYILSNSYQSNVEGYINLIIKNLKEELSESYNYIDQDMIKIFENNYIPMLWKENHIYVDGLLRLYLIVKKIWEQGSKNLYFYTLHNCEHTKVLLKNFETFIKGQYWKLELTQTQILYMYVAFILHDIGMLYLEDTELLNRDTNKIKEKIYDYINKLGIDDYINYSKYIAIRYGKILKSRKIAKYKRRRFIFKQERNSKKLYDFYESFIGCYTRELHALFSIILIENEELGIKRIINDMQLDINIVYTLILGHADITEKLKFKENDINIELLVEIIKLIDLSDITSKRVNLEFYKMFEHTIPEKSKEEYEKHLSVKSLRIDCEQIEEGKIVFLVEQDKVKYLSLKDQTRKYTRFMKKSGIDIKVLFERI